MKLGKCVMPAASPKQFAFAVDILLISAHLQVIVFVFSENFNVSKAMAALHLILQN
jgi:hypothetical protein